jgi:GMP synthase (glutamine-hydrolysing)
VKPVLVVRNDDVDTFGITRSALEEAGVRLLTIDAWDDGGWPAIGEVGGIVMLGGSMNVDETGRHPYLARDRDLAARAVEEGVPYLGLCLGAQLLARALGSPVLPGPVPELGFEPLRPTEAAARDPILSHYRDGDMVFHWHEDTLELPDGAVLLASGDRIAAQAFRVGDRAWGIQFHLEVDAAEIDLWLDAAEAGGEDLPGRWGKPADRVRAESERLVAAHEAKGRMAFRRFAEVVRAASA